MVFQHRRRGILWRIVISDDPLRLREYKIASHAVHTIPGTHVKYMWRKWRRRKGDPEVDDLQLWDRYLSTKCDFIINGKQPSALAVRHAGGQIGGQPSAQAARQAVRQMVSHQQRLPESKTVRRKSVV